MLILVEQWKKLKIYQEKLMATHLNTGKTHIADTHWNYLYRQFQCVPTIYVTENKETSFKFTFQPITMFIVFAYFKHLKLLISIRIPVTTPQIV